MQIYLLHNKSQIILSVIFVTKLQRDSFENLEPQLLEEPLVLARLVALLKLGSDEETSLLFLHWILEDLLVKVGLVKANVDGVTGRHHVVVVDDLKQEENVCLTQIILIILAQTLK